MITLTLTEIQVLLDMLYKSDRYNDGGRVHGHLVNKLEAELHKQIDAVDAVKRGN